MYLASKKSDRPRGLTYEFRERDGEFPVTGATPQRHNGEGEPIGVSGQVKGTGMGNGRDSTSPLDGRVCSPAAAYVNESAAEPLTGPQATSGADRHLMTAAASL